MYCAKKLKPIFVCPVCNETGIDNTSLSHWVRSNNGSVICPTLLGQKCGECGESGHTTKKCLERKRALRDQRRSLFMKQASSGGGQEQEQQIRILSAQPPKNGAYGAETRREEELRRIIADVRKKPEVIDEKDRQIVRVFNV